jgi:hypothetical protein
LPGSCCAALIERMTRAATAASRLIGVLWSVGIACLALITWWNPGATRMFAWPWSLAMGGALLTPVLILVLRSLDSRRVLVLPPTPWLLTAVGGATGVLLSGIFSPFRAQTLLWSAPLMAAIAFFLVVYDFLHATPDSDARRVRSQLFVAGFLTLTAILSLALWIYHLGRFDFDATLANRNAFPLGHSNYTAGIALLLLPIGAGLAVHQRGWKRFAAASSALVALLLLVSSGSRGGVIALAGLAGATLIALRMSVRRKLVVGTVLISTGFLLSLANPRTRAMFTPARPDSAPNISNIQRRAMLTAGWRIGLDRPILGWGPGATPLVFPRYRGGLDGGAENVLQLHSLPAQIWAEFGGVGIVFGSLLTVLIARGAKTQPVAAIALAGYALFSVFDWQLDVPVFGFATAALAALLPAPAPSQIPRPAAQGVAGFSLLALAVVVLFGRTDLAPEMNVRALAGARNPAEDARAVALLRASLALNAHQEIAHLNLGWLLVTTDPLAAEGHFRSAAHLVPDKGAVYFGLGLARLNQGQRDAAARAFALECLNDPSFMSSPWWRDPAIAAVRPATMAALATCMTRARKRLPVDSWVMNQLERVANEASHPGVVPDGPERVYRRERTGYPVLMRNLNLPIPVDVFVVRESAVVANPPLPPKGWIPSSLLLSLLEEPDSPKS